MEFPKKVKKKEHSRVTQKENKGRETRRTAIANEDPWEKS